MWLKIKKDSLTLKVTRITFKLSCVFSKIVLQFSTFTVVKSSLLLCVLFIIG